MLYNLFVKSLSFRNECTVNVAFKRLPNICVTRHYVHLSSIFTFVSPSYNFASAILFELVPTSFTIAKNASLNSPERSISSNMGFSSLLRVA